MHFTAKNLKRFTTIMSQSLFVLVLVNEILNETLSSYSKVLEIGSM